jgi:hypothetical protein
MKYLLVKFGFNINMMIEMKKGNATNGDSSLKKRKSV